MPVYTGTSVDAARSFPNGMPAELRARLNAIGINLPVVPEDDIRRMRVKLELASIDL